MALRGKIAIITGASSGIGAGIAEYFAKEGAKLSLAGRNKDKLENVARECQKHSSEGIITTVGDITEDSTRQILVQKTKEKFDKIDILINNAGMFQLAPLIHVTPEHYDQQMSLNLRTPVFLTALAAPHLIESKGSVVNISSSVSKVPSQMSGVYAMSKIGLDMYTKVLARELGPNGVRVNSINTGIVPTPIYGNVPGVEDISKVLENVRQKSPIGRLGTTEDIARIAAFLVSDSAAFITGENLVADGGLNLVPGF